MKTHMYIDRFMLRKSFRQRLLKAKEVRFWRKRSYIIKPLLNSENIVVYNGCKFVPVPLARNMLKRVIGEFCFTKRLGPSIHSKVRKEVKVIRSK